MSKCNEKWIDLGTGSNQVSSRSLPANFTPSNYTPSQIASEGDDKTSAHLNGIDNKLNFFDDDDYDVGVGGQTNFVSTNDITASNKVDVFVNGRLQREGASHDYQRTPATNTISFNSTVPENAWVRIRVYS